MKKEELVIKKAELKKDNSVDVQFYRKDSEGFFLIKMSKLKRERHPDLDDAFQDLEEYIQDISRIKEEFVMSHISYGLTSDEKNKKSIILTGQYSVMYGKVININTPSIEFDDEDHYEKIDDLIEVCKNLDNEIKEYILGKSSQQKLNFEENDK